MVQEIVQLDSACQSRRVVRACCFGKCESIREYRVPLDGWLRAGDVLVDPGHGCRSSAALYILARVLTVGSLHVWNSGLLLRLPCSYCLSSLVSAAAISPNGHLYPSGPEFLETRCRCPACVWCSYITTPRRPTRESETMIAFAGLDGHKSGQSECKGICIVQRKLTVR